MGICGILNILYIKEAPRTRIMATSSLNEIATVNRVG
jgi:hypothetical protein